METIQPIIPPIIQPTSARNEIENSQQLDIPLLVTGIILVIPVFGAIAWLVYKTIIKRKQRVNDVENPLETAQPKKQSFFRRLYKKIKDKITKKKPVTDVENPPEIAPSKQKSIAVKSSVRSVRKKIKQKKKKPVNKAERLPAAAAESPDSIEKSGKTETVTAPRTESLPSPGSEASLPLNDLFLEQLKASFKKPSENRKRKKVLRTMMIEEIISDDEDTAQYSEAVLQQLNKLCNESPTAHDPKVEVQIQQLDPSEDISGYEADDLPLQRELENIPLLQQSAEPESEVQILQIETTIDMCSDEEGKIPSQAVLETVPFLQQLSDHETEEQQAEDTCVVKEGEPQLQEELFFYFLLSCADALLKYSSKLAAFVQKSSEPQ
ncbi:uncharacterized protein LOC121393751 [Xenopus laevis]|uniref:Uncharacterized protein LOC121393751 n=1 Tax=Xenopus laevis TaxID=8355 RepID=A0A8J1KP12_XENLA|nr:uncharacterized protein LOC121393751 [Xenopus laevis]